MSSLSFGYLKLMVQKANLFSVITGSTYVDITISNHSIVQKGGNKSQLLQIHRKTESIFGLEPVWNDYMEVRCCLGWDVHLVVVITSPDDGECRYDVDKLVVGTCTSGEYYIRDNQTVCGEICFSIDFFPNHQSLRRLVLDTEKEESASCSPGYQLPQLLLNQLHEMTAQNMPSDAESAESYAQQAWSGLYTALQQMLDCASPSLLSDALLAQHFTPTVQLSPSSISIGNRRSHRKDPLLDSEGTPTPPSSPPAAVEGFRVAATARSFLLSLLGDLPKCLAPSPSIALIEKQLCIFTSSRASLSSGESVCSGHTSVTNGTAVTMTWDTVLRFVLVIGVWYLQHSYIGLSLLEEFDLSPKELHAIRSIWEKYDCDLSGDISTDDVPMLLQDMGEVYSSAEVGILLKAIDPDKLQIAEFPEFIRWWCAQSVSDEE